MTMKATTTKVTNWDDESNSDNNDAGNDNGYGDWLATNRDDDDSTWQQAQQRRQHNNNTDFHHRHWSLRWSVTSQWKPVKTTNFSLVRWWRRQWLHFRFLTTNVLLRVTSSFFVWGVCGSGCVRVACSFFVWGVCGTGCVRVACSFFVWVVCGTRCVRVACSFFVWGVCGTGCVTVPTSTCHACRVPVCTEKRTRSLNSV